MERLREKGFSEKHLGVMSPDEGGARTEMDQVPASETEQSGMGAAMGGVVGGAVGAAGGFSAGAAMAAMLLPGVGPILVAGLLGASLLGMGGVAGGAIVGEALENAMFSGIPKDEVFVYEDALRRGRTIVVAEAGDSDQAESARAVLKESGAESVDAAREQWWIGLRDAEREHYLTEGQDFDRDEPYYRTGFEAAQRRPGHNFDEASDWLREHYPAIASQPAFRHGYERGRAYRQKIKQYEQGAPQ